RVQVLPASATGRRCQLALAWSPGRRTQKLAQPLDADAGAVELQELLLGLERQREELGEARAHPRGGIQAVRRLEETGLLLDHPFEELDAAGAAFWDCRILIHSCDFYGSASEAVGLDAALEDAEALLAERRDLQHAELRHVPRNDTGEGADIGGNGGRAHFAALADEAHAERGALAQAGLGHVHVALLEDAQRQPAAREEHGVEREKRNVVH